MCSFQYFLRSRSDIAYNPVRNVYTSRIRALPGNIMPMRPAPRSLPINIHWDCEQTDRNRQPPNGKEDVSHPLCRNPVIQIVGQAKSKHVLNKVHCCKCFAGFVTMAIYNVGNNPSSAELDAEVNETESDDDGYFPRFLRVG
jgi:hypothetical protein